MDFRSDINIESKINEAEVCRNMGLQQDAVDIYERVIAELPPHESHRRDHLQKQITLLQKEINSRDKVDPGSITDGGRIRTILGQFLTRHRHSRKWVYMNRLLPNLSGCLIKTIRMKSLFPNSPKIC